MEHIRLKGDAVPLQRFAVGLRTQTAGNKVVRKADGSNPLPAKREKVFDHLLRRLIVVDGYVHRGGILVEVAALDDREVRVVVVDLLGGEHTGQKHRAVHRPLLQRQQRAAFPLRIKIGRDDHQGITVLLRGLVHAVEDVGEEGVAQIGDQNEQHVRLLLAQPDAEPVRSVVQLLDRFLNTVLCFGRYLFRFV